MVFVTVGNATQGFRRLLDALDRLAGNGCLKSEKVFIQSGNNHEFQPSHCQHEAFLDMEDFSSRIREADLIISHAGAGTVLHALQAGKVPVVMPRRKKYGEHVDDHQIELVQALAAEGRIIPAYELEDLPSAVAEASYRKTNAIPSPPIRMLQLVNQAVRELSGHGDRG